MMTPSPDIKSFYVSPSALLTRKYSVVKMKYRIVECEGVKTLIIPCRSGVTVVDNGLRNINMRRLESIDDMSPAPLSVS